MRCICQDHAENQNITNSQNLRAGETVRDDVKEALGGKVGNVKK